MCGITGAYIFKTEKADFSLLNHLFSRSMLRGKDSFGIIAWNEYEGWFDYKQLKSGVCKFEDIFIERNLKGLTIIIQNSRAEPTTEWRQNKTIKDIPPFRNSRFAITHNGIISNDKELIKEFDLKTDTTIDTSIMPDLLLKKRGICNSIKLIKGGFAFGIIDSKKKSLTLCRNFMPLIIGWQNDIICFASEFSFFPNYDKPFSYWHFWELPHYSMIEIHADKYSEPIEITENSIINKQVIYNNYPNLINNGK